MKLLQIIADPDSSDELLVKVPKVRIFVVTTMLSAFKEPLESQYDLLISHQFFLDHQTVG